MKLSIRSVVNLLLLVILLLSGCTWFGRQATDSNWINWDGTGGWTEREGGRVVGAETGSEPLLESGDMASTLPTEASGSPSGSRRNGQTANLRAGSVDDNAAWDDYLLYRLQFTSWGIPIHELDVTERHVIYVLNPDHLPILGAIVTIADVQGRVLAELQTTSDGRVLFFPALYGLAPEEDMYVTAERDEIRAEAVIPRAVRSHTLVLDAPAAETPVRMDVHFLIDATGSMADEIQQLKENMIAIAESIAAMPSQPDVRFGMTVYRDRGDLFVSRTFDFTPDVERFVDELAALAADGGGDYPESLNEGLHDALRLPEWRGGNTISLIFLIADAPPHLDYADDYDYAEEILFANREGIKIFPLASSGLDDQGEYIFRQIAQITGARFLFLTYGAGGAPGDETTHHVDDYSVLSLDQLVLRLIEEELAHLSTPLP